LKLGDVEVNVRKKGMNEPHKTLNPNVAGLKPSPTVAINERSNALIKAGKKVYKLGLGQSPFPVPERVVAELQKNAFQKDYLQVAGLDLLREAVAQYHQRTDGISASADDVLVGPGSKELMFILQLAYDGELIVPTPTWVSYAPQARIIGREIAYIHTRSEDDWRLMPDALDAFCASDPGRSRLLILNYPNNPTGATYSVEHLKKLAVIAKKHEILLLSDEIYAEVHHRGENQSIASYYPKGTIISSGLSKWCGAGGWRLGTFLFPPSLAWLREAMAAVASETFTSTSAPIQYAAIPAFEGGADISDYLERSRSVLRGLGQAVYQRLRAADLFTVKPEGAFYLFVDFEAHREYLAARDIQNSRDLCARLLEERGVAILPGADFGRPESELSARLAYVNFDGSKAINHLHFADSTPDELFLKKYCGETIEATDSLCDWVAFK
jgi:aspartate aminotransferase